MKTVEYIDAVKIKFDLPSDYALSKLLNCPRGTISAYRLGKIGLGDDMAVRIAELLGVPPGRVLANVHAERSNDATVRDVWEKISASFRRTARHVTALFFEGKSAAA